MAIGLNGQGKIMHEKPLNRTAPPPLPTTALPLLPEGQAGGALEAGVTRIRAADTENVVPLHHIV